MCSGENVIKISTFCSKREETDVLRMICLSLFYNIIFIHQEPMTVHYILDTDLSSSKEKHSDTKEPNKDLRFPNKLKVQIYKIKINFNFNTIISVHVCPCRKINHLENNRWLVCK